MKRYKKKKRIPFVKCRNGKPTKREHVKSDLEFEIWKQIRRKRVEATYETEALPYIIERKYFPDFIIHSRELGKIYVEVKGYLRPEDRSKLRAVKRANPSIDLRLLFAKDNRIPRSKMKYSDWAEKYGFQYAIGKVPEEWVK